MIKVDKKVFSIFFSMIGVTIFLRRTSRAHFIDDDLDVELTGHSVADIV